MANALADAYETYGDFHTAIEAVDETKVLSIFVWEDPGTCAKKIVVVRKT